MTPAELTSICETLYGTRWQAALSRELVRDPRTIRRWASGECPVPKVVAEWVRLRTRRSGDLLTRDLAMLCKRLAFRLSKRAEYPADLKLVEWAMDFLRRHGLQGSILRDDDATNRAEGLEREV